MRCSRRSNLYASLKTRDQGAQMMARAQVAHAPIGSLCGRRNGPQRRLDFSLNLNHFATRLSEHGANPHRAIRDPISTLQHPRFGPFPRSCSQAFARLDFSDPAFYQRASLSDDSYDDSYDYSCDFSHGFAGQRSPGTRAAARKGRDRCASLEAGEGPAESGRLHGLSDSKGKLELLMLIYALPLTLKRNRPNARAPSRALDVRAARWNAPTSGILEEGKYIESFALLYPTDHPPFSQAQARADAVRYRGALRKKPS
jgi:hypothetical protein